MKLVGVGATRKGKASTMFTGVSNETVAWVAVSVATGWAAAQVWFAVEKVQARFARAAA